MSVAYSTKKFSMLADLGTRAGRGGNYGLAKKAAEKMIELCAEHPTGYITLCAAPHAAPPVQPVDARSSRFALRAAASHFGGSATPSAG